MKKRILFFVILAIITTFLSLAIYRPDRNTGIVCVTSPCPSVKPAGRGFPSVFLYERDNFKHYVISSVVLGKFNLSSFFGNVIFYSLLFSFCYFGYSKFSRKTKKK